MTDTDWDQLMAMNTTTHTVRVDGIDILTTDSLEEAARAWDAATHQTFGSTGGITVDTVDAVGNYVRQGWILHVRDGRTYLNPGLVLA